MKYKLVKPLPGIEVGTTIDTLVTAKTYSERKMWEFIASFGSDNDFFETIKESKWWDPEYGEYYYDIHSEYGKHGGYDCDDVNISTGLAFKTKEEAEKQFKLMQAITRCKRYLVENDMLLDSEDLRNKTIKQYIICYSLVRECIDWNVVAFFYYSPYGHINSKENAEKFIKDCEEDLKTIHLPN